MMAAPDPERHQGHFPRATPEIDTLRASWTTYPLRVVRLQQLLQHAQAALPIGAWIMGRQTRRCVRDGAMRKGGRKQFLTGIVLGTGAAYRACCCRADWRLVSITKQTNSAGVAQINQVTNRGPPNNRNATMLTYSDIAAPTPRATY